MTAAVKCQTLHLGIVRKEVRVDKVIVVAPDRVDAISRREVDVLKRHGGRWWRD